MKSRVPVCASLLFVFSAQNAFAADLAIATSTSDKTQYKAADFAQFAPRTALDIVRRIPGFSINSGDSGSRGFGQASGNVLINGQRVSGKSNDAESVLGRISTANVNRIEVLDGTALGIPGLSGQVVNVTTRDSGGVSGTWKWKVRSRENLRPTWNDFGATVSGQRGALSWAVEAASAPERGASAGPERARKISPTMRKRHQLPGRSHGIRRAVPSQISARSLRPISQTTRKSPSTSRQEAWWGVGCFRDLKMRPMARSARTMSLAWDRGA